MVKKCANCGAQIADDSLFCAECGKQVYRDNTFPHCGESVTEGDVFFQNCGKRVDELSSNANSGLTQKRCLHCGSFVNDDDVFCENCGRKIADDNSMSNVCYQKTHKTTSSSQNKKNLPILIGVLGSCLFAFALIGGGWYYYNYYFKSKMSGRVIAKNDSVAQVDSTIVQEFVGEVDDIEQIDTIVDFPDEYATTEFDEDDRIEEYDVIDNPTSARYPEREHEEIESYGREENNKIFDKVEQMPSFPGGNNALLRYLNNNVCYPSVAVDNGLQGKVVVSFVVERDGSITDIKVVQSVAPSLDEEAVRVIRSMPRWQAGIQDGKPVRVKYNLPVSFRLQ